MLFCAIVWGQSYPPQAGWEGSTAYDGTADLWASSIEITRGYQNIQQPELGETNAGEAQNCLGENNGQIVSLGDGGEALLSFEETPFSDGAGADFVVYENGFLISGSDEMAFLELAFVEVSSDGVHFYRFPAVNEYDTTEQIGTFEPMNARYLNNFAGKYIGGYGTPFDLAELPDSPNLDKNQIKFVKIIDVVGSIDAEWGTSDSLGNTVNDPFPTAFDSGGFDLDAVGAFYPATMAVTPTSLSYEKLKIYPNPAQNWVYVNRTDFDLKLFNSQGVLVKWGARLSEKFSVMGLAKGVYFVEIKTNNELEKKRLIVK